MKKFRIDECAQFAFTGQIIFGDFERLLQQALFEFDEVAVIP
jgi:hypothetical protein